MSDQDKLDKIKLERQVVYGPPRQNHRGIGMMWGPILQPHWLAIKRGDPVPEHVVALLMSLLKIDRMRMVFHEDNYDDAENYLEFAKQWQSDFRPIEDERIRFFIAGPYSADNNQQREHNVMQAAKVGLELIKKGHLVYIPHTMTHQYHGLLGYRVFLEQTLNIIDEWATAVFLVGHSPGADIECAHADAMGLPIYTSLGQVPIIVRLQQSHTLKLHPGEPESEKTG